MRTIRNQTSPTVDRPSDVRASHDAIAIPTPPLRDRLLGVPSDNEASGEDLLHLARGRVVGGCSDHDGILEDLIARAMGLLGGPDADTQRPFALELLSTCAVELALVGKHRALFDVMAAIVADARRTSDAVSRFRVARIAFACELARGDERAACDHAERAYRIALELGTTAARFESLILVVLLLEAMGLRRDACTLALNLCEWRGDGPSLEFERLQRVNAIHGLRICHGLDDLESAQRFFGRLRDAVDVDAMTAAVVAAAKSAHLIWIGKPRSAARSLNDALARPDVRASLRAMAIVRCAEAEVRIAIGDADGLRCATVVLQDLLRRAGGSSVTHREIRKMLIRLDLRSAGAQVESVQLEACRSEPHWVSQADIPLDFLWWTTSGADHLARSSAATSRPEHEEEPFASAPPSFVEVGFDFDDFIAAKPDACAAESEASLRSPHYRIVESWTIAAEIAAGGNGRQCFKVGRVAAALGAALGFSDDRCVMLEMGCRLRDFGRAAVDCIEGDRHARVDPDWVEAERAKAAERMLSFSNEPVLRLAARIAKHRRNWWNGAGSSSVLKGEGIPVEARICAVADALVEMVDPLEHRRRWSIESALKQIGCMGGVRFDPTLVGLLARVLRYEPAGDGPAAWCQRPVVAEDSLGRAKKHLFETLELVE